MLLQELGSATALANLQAYLPGYDIHATTHTIYGRGKGVALAVSKALAPAMPGPPTIDNDLQLIHARFDGLVPGRPHTQLHIINMYLPGINSAQLARLSSNRPAALEARLTALQQRIDSITAAASDSLIIVGGDLNAKIGCAPPGGAAPLTALLAARLPTHRTQLLDTINAAGRRLNDLCEALDLVNLTGLIPGDIPLPPPSQKPTVGALTSRIRSRPPWLAPPA